MEGRGQGGQGVSNITARRLHTIWPGGGVEGRGLYYGTSVPSPASPSPGPPAQLQLNQNPENLAAPPPFPPRSPAACW